MLLVGWETWVVELSHLNFWHQFAADALSLCVDWIISIAGWTHPKCKKNWLFFLVTRSSTSDNCEFYTVLHAWLPLHRLTLYLVHFHAKRHQYRDWKWQLERRSPHCRHGQHLWKSWLAKKTSGGKLEEKIPTIRSLSPYNAFLDDKKLESRSMYPHTNFDLHPQ